MAQRRSTGLPVKPSFAEIPAKVLWQVASLLTSTLERSKTKQPKEGGKQYGFMGWRTTPDAKTKYRDSALRHLLKMAMGERMDEDSGFPHSVCLVANALILADLDLLESDEETSSPAEESDCEHLARTFMSGTADYCLDCKQYLRVRLGEQWTTLGRPA